LNGIEAAQQIGELSPETQVLILSMHSSSEHIFRALQAGARGYLLKESAGGEVVDAVRTVHSGRLYLSRKISDVVSERYVLGEDGEEAKSPLMRLSVRERSSTACRRGEIERRNCRDPGAFAQDGRDLSQSADAKTRYRRFADSGQVCHSAWSDNATINRTTSRPIEIYRLSRRVRCAEKSGCLHCP